jgi:hypothetical protein
MRLLEKTRSSPLQGLLHKLQYAAAIDPDAAVCCAACLQAVTSNKERVEIQGGTEHVHINPHGLRFHIICYREAAGCVQEGTSTSLHTWFAGYDWCYAICGNCAGHLGWHYNAPGRDRFYGLIKDRLVESRAARQ